MDNDAGCTIVMHGGSADKGVIHFASVVVAVVMVDVGGHGQ